MAYSFLYISNNILMFYTTKYPCVKNTQSSDGTIALLLKHLKSF